MYFINILVSAATNLVTGENMLGGLIVAIIALSAWVVLWHRSRRKEGKSGVQQSHVIFACLVGAGSLLILGAVASVWWPFSSNAKPSVAQPSNQPTVASQPPVASPNPTVAASRKSQPEYLKEISFTYDSQTPLGFSAVVGKTTDRLRIVVESSWERLQGSGHYQFPPTIIQYPELRDLVRGAHVQMQLVFKADKQGPMGNEYFWGDPAANFPVTVFNRARLVLIGPEGEQHEYFFVIRSLPNQPFTILREKDFDWIREWRAKEP